MLLGEQIQHGEISESRLIASSSHWGGGGPLSESEKGRQGTWRVRQKRRYKVISLEDGKFRKCRSLKEPGS